MEFPNNILPFNFNNLLPQPALLRQPLPPPAPYAFPQPLFSPILTPPSLNLSSSGISPSEPPLFPLARESDIFPDQIISAASTVAIDSHLSSTSSVFQNLKPCNHASQDFQTISWFSPDNVVVSQMLSPNNGVMLLTDLGVTVPMREVRETFCHLFQNPPICTQLNELRCPRGIYKFKSFMDKSIDQKLMLDFHLDDIIKVFEKGIEMGPAFNNVLDFYNELQFRIIPRLMDLHYEAICGDINRTHMNWNKIGFSPAERIRQLHVGKKHSFRLVDYPPVHKKIVRCGEHRDNTTFTLIFQDQIQGGLEVLLNGKWIPVPTRAEVVLIWGWSTFILSNGRLHSPTYRVVPALGRQDRKAPRRNEVVLYVTPDWAAPLIPLLRCPEEILLFNFDSIRDLTFGVFNEVFGAKWHKREGTTTEQEDRLLRVLNNANYNGNFKRTQENDIIEFLMGKWDAMKNADGSNGGILDSLVTPPSSSNLSLEEHNSEHKDNQQLIM